MDLIQAVRELRRRTGDSQQAFANRLGLSIRAIANYEKDREPTGKALAALAALASDTDSSDLAYDFMRALGNELDLSKIKASLYSYGEGQGYLLVNLQGSIAAKYAFAFGILLRQFQRDEEGPEAKARATRLLDQMRNGADRLMKGLPE